MAGQLTDRWPDLTVGLVHGRLKAEERDDVMRRFRAGEVRVLVATTVIEVGIDVPNATLMVIEHPERFGLAQLHQLRGRVGRGAGESHCILLSPGHAPPRLKAFAATEDGFRIAELDLLERKQGDLLGQRQSGSEEIRLARFPDDADLLEQARALARRILETDPALEKKQHAVLRARTLSRYPRGEVLFRIG
jgi:ATP-dependent DNA helicase RecG